MTPPVATAEHTLVQMQIVIPNGCVKDYSPKSAEEYAWEARVVSVDGVAGFICCPDCIADERVSDVEMLKLNNHSGGSEYGCILCKDTGRMWVSL
jgi:hypothetical protein